MNIAFDAKRAFANASGLGNYSRSLIKSLSQTYPEHTYSLFTPEAGNTAFYKTISKQKNISVIQPENKIFPAYWRSFEITNLLNNASLYHGLSNELPFNIKKFKKKKIVTIHDLIFLRHPKLYPIIDREIYNLKFKAACANADYIIAVSEQTKNDIIQFYNTPENKIKIIYQSCDEAYYKEISIEQILDSKKKHNLPDNYLLYVGTIEERKNLITILQALSIVKTIPLVVVGRKKKYFNQVMEYILVHNLSERIIFLDNICAKELPPIYKGASVFIYPSIYEGFGIPIIEALTCKTPVITTKNGCFEEAGGKHSVYISPLNHEQLAEEIQTILNSSDLQRSMVENGYEHSKKFRPEAIAKDMIELYMK